MGRVKTVVLDKTGTVTEGKPRLTDMACNNIEETELLRLAAAVEQPSGHPLSLAVLEAAEERNIPIPAVTDFAQREGGGVSACWEGHRLYGGNGKYMTVVAGGRVVGRGHNLVETLTDVTAHAEMQAITAAADTLGGKYLQECTLYVTVEPCVMCAGALAWSQIGRIVYGAADAKRGYSRFGKELLHPRTEVVSGVLAAECEKLMTDFFAKLR
ncbi:MAG: HAD family hydrolase [Alistipes sp.]|nr:HAD family hydrolase [Alistipes sp.]